MAIQTKENKDGSITLIGKKCEATVPKSTIELTKLFHFKLEELIQKCPKCKSKAFLRLRERKENSGKIQLHYLCLDCGHKKEIQIIRYEGYV